jgi:ribosomal protein S18 acetylase RimI-like enzyme
VAPIEPLVPSDLPAAAAVLGRAFHANPGLVAILKDDSPAERLRLTTIGMGAFARAVQRVGNAEVIKQDGKVVAVSLSYGPGAYPPSLATELRIGSGLLRGGLRRLLRFGQADAVMRKRHLREPHWYLWVLGVDPEQQGRGFGSELLRALSARAEHDRVPCYLETDKPSSVQLYEHHGYAVRDETVVPGLDFRLWFMLRPSASGG